MAQLITLNGVEIKQPKPGDFGIERYTLSTAGRVASGKMMIEIVAKKTKLTFKYDVLKGADLKTIADIVDGDTAFFDAVYMDDNGEIKTITVYAGALKYVNFRSSQGIYWREISFDLIQQ
jgi:hypothetical protein